MKINNPKHIPSGESRLRKIKVYLKAFFLNSNWAIVASATILCFWAIYNTYPLIFNCDTAMYIDSAFTGKVRSDRPILYGLFMKYTSLHYSLWLVVIVQALMVSLVIYYYFKYFVTNRSYVPYYIGFVTVVSFFMGASFISSWLMADVFTPLSILCIGLLLFVKELKKRDFVIISFLALFSITMHNSHFYICFGLLFLLIAGFIVRPIKKVYKTAGLRLSRLLFTLSLTIGSIFFLSLVHYLYGGGFKSSRGSTIFLTSNLVEMGIMDAYLEENCNQKHYTLCRYKDSIPTNFLWGGDDIPLKKMGGWEKCESEYSAINKEILTTPKYLKIFIYKSVLLTLKQFFHFDTGEAYIPNEWINNSITMYYTDDFFTFIDARQSKGKLDFDLVNYIQTIIVAICLFAYIIILLYKKMDVKYRLFISFILLALLINAWVCGTFSGVYPRYQSRLVWLLPLPLFLYAMENTNIGKILNFIKNKIKTLKVKKTALSANNTFGKWV